MSTVGVAPGLHSPFTGSFLCSVRILVQAEENRRSSSHPRTDVTHQLSALQGNARTDRSCHSFHSSRPRATATLLIHARVRVFVCASKSSVRTCVRQSAAIVFASTNQNGWLISFFLPLKRFPRFFTHVIVRVRIHFIYDAISSLFLILFS